MTLISVVTATYNCAGTIEDCLRSVRSQSHADIEHIVIDGGSSDGTLELLQQAGSGIAHLVSEQDGGIYDALNKGISRATGDVLGFLHADDLFGGAESIAHIAAAFADPNVVAVHGDLLYVAKDDIIRTIRYWRAGVFRPGRLKLGWMPAHPTLYLRREAYQALGGFDTSFRIAADYDFMLRFLRSTGGKIVYLPEVLVRMRVGGASNRSLRNIVRKSAEDYRALRKNGVGGFGTLFLKNSSKLGQFFIRPGAGPAAHQTAGKALLKRR